MKPGIQVIIMAHHRQQETLRAITALKKVNFGVFTEIVLSDNADDESHVIQNVPEGIIHRVRNPSGGSLWHATQIFKELEYEWTLLTHDDDEILPSLGDLFQKYHENQNIGVITGLSQIIGLDGKESFDEGYENRLRGAKLFGVGPSPRTNLSQALFDLGPIFPASAIIARTKLLKETHKLNPDYELAGDLAFSLQLADQAPVIFEGRWPIMNYHMHGGNSVFSVAAAGGLMADFTIVRLDYVASNSNKEINHTTKQMLTNAVIASRILANSFNLKDRYRNVLKYARRVKTNRHQYPIYWYAFLPIPIGIFKPVVRRLMWRRLGIKRWSA
jgi:hypothetical protein